MPPVLSMSLRAYPTWWRINPNWHVQETSSHRHPSTNSHFRNVLSQRLSKCWKTMSSSSRPRFFITRIDWWPCRLNCSKFVLRARMPASYIGRPKTRRAYRPRSRKASITLANENDSSTRWLDGKRIALMEPKAIRQRKRSRVTPMLFPSPQGQNVKAS